ncbi:MAG: phosphoribulokinase, partial [Gammaproteobacteria bacterium]|nr:phosphoribulokinase [Gammaproteobacteria bacterium]
MSQKHPVVAVTGSSGAGTTTVKRAFEHIFYRDGIKPLVIEGDSYHRFNRVEMREAVANDTTGTLSHFGPEANLFDVLAETFENYGKTGGCKRRYYLHSKEEAAAYPGLEPGEFTPWEEMAPGTDLLFYEGLHG